MQSLRARLIAGLLALGAIGLLLLGGITYLEQRSFLQKRVDQQVSAAGPAIARAVEGDDVGSFGNRGPGLGGPPGAINLPPGTYGERRSPTDATIGSPVLLAYGQTSGYSVPKLPKHIAPGNYLTVAAAKGSQRFRVLATRSPDTLGGTVVVAVPLREMDQTLARLRLVEALVIGGVLLVLGLGAALVVRLGLRPLDRMSATADAIAAGELSRRVEPATTKTEVGRLGLALNAMLGRLEGAFAEREESEDRLRHFVADASHELRTPLASIRGYAELFGMGAARDEADLEKTMKRIEDEAKRMGVLVEDLLTLARLDEVREDERVPVDLAPLARDAAADARVIAPEREISLSAPDGGVTVLGDPDRLRQVLGNLLRNALVHTPDGTPVEVDVRRVGAEVSLSVRDHGPGLPDGEAEALFERFWRAESGRERGKAGAGLGLAIVAGIVGAHHGSVTAANASGGGARFEVLLPASGSPAPAGRAAEATPQTAST
jgi:two-component system, OmpR family, sensor kinase